MNIHEILSSPAAAAEREGPSNKIVWSSRVRLARNLANTPFPGWAKKSVRVETFNHIRDNVLQVGSMKDSFDTGMDKLTTLDKQILVERHFISREHAAKNTGSGLVLSQDESISVMINEEDHLRIISMEKGYNIRAVFDRFAKLVEAVETACKGVGRKLEISDMYGNILSCPSNCGTRLRASMMIKVPLASK
jgi:protein arginine kinase